MRAALVRSLVAGVAAMGAFARADDLVVNGNFATGGIDGWSLFNAPFGSAFFVQNAWGHSDSISVGFAATSFFVDDISQILPTTAGRDYDLSFWIFKCDGPGDQLAILWEGRLLTDMSPIPGPAQTWQHFVYRLTAQTSGSELHFLGRDPPSVFYFDDVSVTPVAPPCPVDFDGDGTVDFFDYDAFVVAFEAGC